MGNLNKAAVRAHAHPLESVGLALVAGYLVSRLAL